MNSPSDDRRPLRLALTLWLVLAAAVGVKTFVVGGEHSVYPVFAGGVRHWWADMSLYANYEQSEGLDGYRYSPAFAVAFTPFVILGQTLGAIAWGVLNVCLSIWSLHVLTRDVLPGHWPAQREARFLILTLVGSAVGIWSGQSNAIISALVMLAMAAVVRRQWWLAAALLAVPVFIKLWPLAVVLLFMACWPRELIGRFVVVCLLLVLVPFLTRPPEIVAWQYTQWYASLTGPLQGRWPGYRDAWTIWEQIAPLFACQPDQAVFRRAYTAIQLLAAAMLLGWTLWQRQQRHADKHPGGLLMAVFSMWTCWQLLFGPGSEQLTYGLIAAPASWAVLESIERRRGAWLTAFAWSILALLPAGDVEKALLFFLPGAQAVLPLGVVLLAGWLICRSSELSDLPADGLGHAATDAH